MAIPPAAPGPFVETPLPKPEWGTKRTCQSCGSKFYDFGRTPIVCPNCGAVFDLEVLTRTRRSRSAPRSSPVAVVDEEEERAPAAASSDDDADTEDEAVTEDGAAEEDGESGDDDDDESLIEDASELSDDDEVEDVIEGEIDDDEQR